MSDVDEDPGYKPGEQWAGHDRWVCTDPGGCAFDTLVESDAAAHARDVHGVGRPDPVRLSPLLGPQGQPIVVVDVDPSAPDVDPELAELAALTDDERAEVNVLAELLELDELAALSASDRKKVEAFATAVTKSQED